MKYITPELIARSRSDDDSLAEAVFAEWEVASNDYKKRLESVDQELPRAVRRLVRQFDLHDAKVLTMTADETPHLCIFLELGNPASQRDKHIELRYRLAGGLKNGLRVLKHPSLAGDGKPLGWWLYDEFDVPREGECGTALTHSILFTGGYELQVAFYGLRLSRLRFVLPPASAAVEETVKELERISA